jgi:hypothetical protein
MAAGGPNPSPINFRVESTERALDSVHLLSSGKARRRQTSVFSFMISCSIANFVKCELILAFASGGFLVARLADAQKRDISHLWTGIRGGDDEAPHA